MPKPSKPLAPKRKRKLKGLKTWKGCAITPAILGKKLYGTMTAMEYVSKNKEMFSATLVNAPVTKEFFAKDGAKLTLIMPGLL